MWSIEASSPESPVQIYECIYRATQSASSNCVVPLVIDNTNPERRELQAYVEIFRKGLFRQSGFTGVFSPKFQLKTHVSVRHFQQFAAANPSADVCLINPFPQIRYWSFNVWMQGEHAHPGLLARSQALLDAVGISLNLATTPRHNANYLAYSNFWVATPAFWQEFVGKVLMPISNFLDQFPTHPAVTGVLQDTQHTEAAPFLPFMIERLFSTWLSKQTHWRVATYPVTADDLVEHYCLNDFERLLVQMMQSAVDQSDASGVFPKDLKDRMNDVCALFQQHFFDYYEHRPHPHTGIAVRKQA